MQPIRNKQERKYSHAARRLTRETSMSKLAMEDYLGAPPVAVPFNWESEPGTPKVNSCREIRLPSLTPPPSYFSSVSTPRRPPTKSNTLFGSIFPRRGAKKGNSELSPVSYSSSSSSTSSSDSSSPWNSVPSSPTARGRPSKVFDARDAEEEAEYGSSPVSTLCFRVGRRGCYSSAFKVLFRDVE